MALWEPERMWTIEDGGQSGTAPFDECRGAVGTDMEQ